MYWKGLSLFDALQKPMISETGSNIKVSGITNLMENYVIQIDDIWTSKWEHSRKISFAEMNHMLYQKPIWML